MAGRPVSAVSIVIAVGWVSSWTLAGLSAWWQVDPRGLAIEVGAGTALSVIAALIWHDAGRTRADAERAQADEDKAILIRTLAECCPPRPLARTLPFPRLPRVL
jgi:hypothetical protein